ncbi:MAG: hypothetical protein L7W95_06200 [Alphaproteobacteria bacterium]|jgi:hypothetical protein|nr:hypothetical protein [Alphaproteobacteria bacterium]
MSRLDEAETRFAEAVKALESALERRLAAAAATGGSTTDAAGGGGPADGALDATMLRAELARIDERVSRAMQLISDAQQSDLTSVTVGEEGRA